MLEWSSPARSDGPTGGGVAPGHEQGAPGDDDDPSLPATGGGTALAAVGVGIAAALLRRR